jgi:hypothetical protein
MKCKIQTSSGSEKVLNDRDGFIENYLHLKDSILACRLFPATYNTERTKWIKISDFLRYCEIDTDSKNITLEFIAEKILSKTLSEKHIHIQEKVDWLALKLFCNPKLIKLTDSKYLWHPISRWLSLDTFETICTNKYQGTIPWFIITSN